MVYHNIGFKDKICYPPPPPPELSLLINSRKFSLLRDLLFENFNIYPTPTKNDNDMLKNVIYRIPLFALWNQMIKIKQNLLLDYFVKSRGYISPVYFLFFIFFYYNYANI